MKMKPIQAKHAVAMIKRIPAKHAVAIVVLVAMIAFALSFAFRSEEKKAPDAPLAVAPVPVDVPAETFVIQSNNWDEPGAGGQQGRNPGDPAVPDTSTASEPSVVPDVDRRIRALEERFGGLDIAVGSRFGR